MQNQKISNGVNKLVSVNILTYNGQDLIGSCLESVLGQTYPDIEVLVIDNNSADNTVEIVKGITKGTKENLRVIVNKKNLGVAAGYNIGIRKSKGEYVLCLNQDIVLDKDFIKKGVEVMEKDKKIGAVQGKLLKITDINKPESNIIDHTGLVILKNRRVIARGQGERDKGQYNKTEEIFGVDGAAPLYRRTALEDIRIPFAYNSHHNSHASEYFDEDFFCYKEDVDLAWRMQLYEWKTIYQSKAIAYHLRGAGERAVRNYISVALARRKISRFAKFHSFKNDRLMRIKNELPGLFLRDIFYIIIKEIGAWAYVLIFEHYTWKAIKALFKEIPEAWRKRKIIMAKKRATTKGIKRWFV